MPQPLPEIAFDAPRGVRETLGELGRTEDVRLAPGRRRVAIACYHAERIAVGDVELTRSPEGPSVAVTRLELLSSPLLREPHGVDWRDDETLVVANRGGAVAVLRLAGSELAPVGGEAPPGGVDAPGSIVVRRLEGNRHEVLVCDNWRSEVARYELDANGTLTGGWPLLGRWLDLPDGIASSDDGRWLAVSNHNTHSVLVFDREAAEQDVDPAAVLRGVDYPHGLRFAANDSRLLVADAGSPRVHVFVAPADGWTGPAYPAATIDVMDEPTFLRGRRNPAEGGPKGIDLDPRTHVLLVTCEERPLAFFDAAPVLERPEDIGIDRGALLRHELAALAAARAEREATANARAELAAVLGTKAWRLTAPARRLYAALGRIARRRSGTRDALTDSPR
jgi:Lipoprotein LpqB beta-propeller domain